MRLDALLKFLATLFSTKKLSKFGRVSRSQEIAKYAVLIPKKRSPFPGVEEFKS